LLIIFARPLPLGLRLPGDGADHYLIEINVLDLDIGDLDPPRIGPCSSGKTGSRLDPSFSSSGRVAAGSVTETGSEAGNVSSSPVSSA
jgi:hypothetical protein